MTRRVKRGRERLRACAVMIVLTASLAAPAEASAWNREKGRLFVISRAEYFSAAGGPPIGPDGEITRFRRFETNDYLEYGLTRRLMVGGKIAYGESAFSNGLVETSASGFSQADAFIQRQLRRGRRGALAVKLTGGAPTRIEAGLRQPLAGDGADVELAALYGRALTERPLRLFVGLEAGYRKRFGDGADEIRADLSLGAEPVRAILLLAEVFATRSLRNESPGGADYDVIKIQGAAVYRFARRWSVEVGYRHEVAGRNLLLGGGAFIGLWSSF